MPVSSSAWSRAFSLSNLLRIFPGRVLLRRAVVAAGIAVLLGVAAISVYGWRDQVVDTGLLVVPGSQVHEDGTLSMNLEGRLEAALAYYEGGHARRVLVSGGVGKEHRDEAMAMRDYLVAHGVPDSVIIVDSHGDDSFQTARFAAQVARERGLGSVAVATSFFHVARMGLALRNNGIEMVGHVHSRRHEPRDIYSVLREVPGMVVYAGRRP